MRINFSNSGVSYSAGIRGARISTSRRGTYVTIGASGIYYRQKIGGTQNVTPPRVVPQNNGIHTITSAPIDELTDVDSKTFVDELNEKAGKFSLKNWLGIWPMMFFIVVLSFNSLSSKETIFQPAGLRDVAVINSGVGSYIRSSPNASSKILGTVKNGEEFTLLDATKKKWFKIKYNDSIGYVSKKLAQTSIINDAEQSSSDIYLTNPAYFWILGVGTCLFLILIYFLNKLDRKRFEMEINYEMDEQMNTIYNAFTAHFAHLISSNRKWQYLHGQNNYDWKRNAGAGKLINRVAISQISPHKAPISYFKTNVSIPNIKLRNTELYFLPERLLVRRGNKFASVFYKNLLIESQTTRFIETEILAPDAKVVAYTWKYVNRNGGPDRRFSHNRKLPICHYSEYTIKSATGINEKICTSKLGAFDRFAEYCHTIGSLQSRMHTGPLNVIQ